MAERERRRRPAKGNLEGRESLRKFPTVAVVFDANPLDEKSYTGLVTVVRGKLDELCGKDTGIFFMLGRGNKRASQISEALGGKRVDDKPIIYGRLLERTGTAGALVAPIVTRRQSPGIHHTGYEGVVVRLSPEALAGETIHIAELREGFPDLEGNVKDFSPKAPYYRVKMPGTDGRWAYSEDIEPK